MKNVAFCFISHSAHVRHLLPIAVEYSKLCNKEVDLLVSSDLTLAELNKVLSELGEHNCNVKYLRGGLFKSLIGRIKGRLYPNVKNLINTNKKLFLSYDILITPHHNLDHVMKLDVKRNIKYVCTFHGAGDGEVGFDKRFSDYDLLLVSGVDIQSRLEGAGIKHEGNEVHVVGYPKLDMIKSRLPISIGFTNNAPTVLYNPHYASHLSSWFLDGKSVLKWFSVHPEFNLIFAPHVKLFDGVLPEDLKEYLVFNNIVIDCGSERSTDATYTQVADIYLGDVSSQVYEALYFSCKPLIFLNTHGVDWFDDKNYKMWRLGCVLLSVDGLNDVFRHVQEQESDPYQALQKEILDSKFARFDCGSARKAANEIYSYAKKG